MRVVAEKLSRGLDTDAAVASDRDEILVSGDNHLRLACKRAFKKFVVRGIALDDAQSFSGFDDLNKRKQLFFNQTLDVGFRELKFRLAENPKVFLQNIAR